MNRYRHLFFDLDHTVWDFRTNSREVLAELFQELALGEAGVESVEALIEEYEEINKGLWERYEAGTIDKDVMRVLRFRNTLLRFGVRNTTLAARMGDLYLQRTPLRSALHEGAKQLLIDLRAQYATHLITNGFEEVQATKLRSSGIEHLFDQVITSERAGARKPHPEIFHHALKKARANVTESLMIGDSISADMDGARSVGMDHVHFATEGELDPRATYRIRRFAELRPLLLLQ